jgi:iron complex transport system substrate-binding protein
MVKVKFHTGILVLCCLAAFFSLVGCAKKEAQSASAQAAAQTDSAPPTISRIISAAPSNTAIIAGLGFGGAIIACDPYSKKITGVTPDALEIDFFYPDTEAILKLKPDIIFTDEINSYGATDSPYTIMNDLGLRVVSIPAAKSFEEIYGTITQIAGILSAEEKGAALVAKMKSDIADIVAASEKAAAQGPNAKKPRVFFVIELAPAIISLGSGSYLNEMLELVGAENIFARQKGYFSTNDESVISANPDVILSMSYTGSDMAEKIAAFPGFDSINAVKNGRIYLIDGDSASQASQNVMKAFREIAENIYPGLAVGEK